jgi:hypothetical protein
VRGLELTQTHLHTSQQFFFHLPFSAPQTLEKIIPKNLFWTTLLVKKIEEATQERRLVISFCTTLSLSLSLARAIYTKTRKKNLE